MPAGSDRAPDGTPGLFPAAPAEPNQGDATLPTFSTRPSLAHAGSTWQRPQFTPRAPSPGQLVHIRQRRYFVEETVPPRTQRRHAVRLACVDDDAQGQPLQVLWEREVDPEIRGRSLGRPWRQGLRRPAALRRLPARLRWNAVTAADPRLFQSPFRAGIRLDATSSSRCARRWCFRGEPLHRRRRRPRQDHRGGAHRPRAAAAPEGPRDRRRLPAVGAPPMAGRAGSPVRAELRGPRPGVHRTGPARARLRREPLDHAHALPRLARAC